MHAKLSQTATRPTQKLSSATVGRRAAVGLVALGALLPRQATAADDAGGFSISITRADPSVKDYLERRDKAAENKCPGGMMDCEGDRREYAKQQWKDFLESGGVPKRLREGKRDGPRSY